MHQQHTTGKQHNAAYVLQVTLEEIRPLIWRRLAVPDCSLVELHMFLQIVMGWENSHLYRFDAAGDRYSEARSFEDSSDDADAAATLLSDLVDRLSCGSGGSGGKTFWYVYDFGDRWRHMITIEQVSDRASQPPVPHCLQGQRACPPEDVGGVMGYEAFVKAITDPRHELHEEMLEWHGSYDPERFNCGKVNQRLRRFR